MFLRRRQRFVGPPTVAEPTCQRPVGPAAHRDADQHRTADRAPQRRRACRVACHVAPAAFGAEGPSQSQSQYDRFVSQRNRRSFAESLRTTCQRRARPFGGRLDVQPGTRTAIAQEVSNYLRQIVTAANTQFRGRYLFAGSNTTYAPFDSDGKLVTYHGNRDPHCKRIPTTTSYFKPIRTATVSLGPSPTRCGVRSI